MLLAGAWLVGECPIRVETEWWRLGWRGAANSCQLGWLCKVDAKLDRSGGLGWRCEAESKRAKRIHDVVSMESPTLTDYG